MQTEEILKEIGLTDREIKVYLTGLKTGPILATKLAKKTEINRTNLYSILNSLQERGLVSQGSKGLNKHFIMEPPVKLKEYLERKIDREERIKKELDGIIPNLKSLTPDSVFTPQIKIFEGAEGELCKRVLAVGVESESSIKEARRSLRRIVLMRSLIAKRRSKKRWLRFGSFLVSIVFGK